MRLASSTIWVAQSDERLPLPELQGSLCRISPRASRYLIIKKAGPQVRNRYGLDALISSVLMLITTIIPIMNMQ